MTDDHDALEEYLNPCPQVVLRAASKMCNADVLL